MAVSAGSLNKRITIKKRTIIDDGLAEKQTYTVDATVFASVNYIRDSERFLAGSVQRNASCRFVIRKRDVTHDDIISYQSRDYDIDGIKELDNGAFLEITAGLKVKK